MEMKCSLAWIPLVLILMLTPELLAQLGSDVSSGPVQHRSEGNHPASAPRSGFATVAPVEIAPPVLMHVSAGDLLEFSVFGVPDLTQRVRVNNAGNVRSEEHTSELQSRQYLVCRLLLE